MNREEFLKQIEELAKRPETTMDDLVAVNIGMTVHLLFDIRDLLEKQIEPSHD